MNPVTLTHVEFIEAVAEVAKRTGRSPGDVAAGLASKVTVSAPPAPPVSMQALRRYTHDAAQLSAATGCSLSSALASLDLKDYADGE